MSYEPPRDPAYLDVLETQFPELLRDCGERQAPGLSIAEEWRDWSERPTTPDQLAIERYLAGCDLKQRRILHVGTGNSSLARRFHGTAGEIVGLTINPEEVELAERLALPGYRVLPRNKYLADSSVLGGPFDFIVDNNPTTFACCLRHFGAMMRFYGKNLAPGGQLLTERLGLGWVCDATKQDPRWGFDFADLAAAGAMLGLKAYREGSVYILSTERPKRFGFGDRATLRLHRVRDRLLAARRLAR